VESILSRTEPISTVRTDPTAAINLPCDLNRDGSGSHKDPEGIYPPDYIPELSGRTHTRKTCRVKISYPYPSGIGYPSGTLLAEQFSYQQVHKNDMSMNLKPILPSKQQSMTQVTK
jgi:hypothetical protein